MTKIISDGRSKGITPAVALVNPKYPHNVGAVIRAASCFGIGQVFYSGSRIDDALRGKKRIPREERMKAYNDVDLCHMDYFYDAFDHATPVCVEVNEHAESLHTFEHPENAIYVFGPEDDSLDSMHREMCHRFVVIPTRHCTNLAAAVYVVLYDRAAKAMTRGDEEFITPGIHEQRGWAQSMEAGIGG